MLAKGTIIGGKYRLEEPIGQGGMATVWRAVHTTLDRSVAVKFLEAVGTQSQQLAARFLQEAKLCAGLRHRHVVDIVDFGVEDDQPFMVMEYLEGSSLADRYVDGPPISDIELIEIVCMTLSGLAAVHDAGILHRDVKPENIFLVTDADGTYPKLLDFGVSRGLGGGNRFTKTGAVVGTPQYMSPEQARGKRDIDHRSDLYAVGTLLYEGFTGEVPFDSENPGDVLIMVATENHVPLADLRPDLPEGVIEVVHKALHKRPEERFQTAREMRDALIAELEWGDTSSGSFAGSGLFPASGTGLIRVTSGPGGPQVQDLVKQRRGDPVTFTEEPGAEVQIELLAESEPPPELHTARLPPLRAPSPPAPRAQPSRAWVGAVVAVLVVALGGVTFWQLDGMRLLGLGPAGSGAVGEVRPGAEVAPVVSAPPPPEDETTVAFAPPPTDGVAAPDAETVDVPSPPDPPEAAPEELLGAGEDEGDGDGAE